MLDLWPESVVSAGNLKSSVIPKILNPIVKFIYKNSDRILVSSNGFINSIEDKGVNRDKIEFFPQWAEPIFKPTRSNKYLLKGVPENSFKIMFAGNIGEAQDFSSILETANQLKHDESIQWVILGGGRREAWVRSKIKEFQLGMNLSRVVHLPQKKKTIFFFTAEGRVDFRQLIKELVSNLKHRIEMKQAGVRDEARAIKGASVCGETLCCATFIEEFTPVTIRMAKDQGLALNPSKISGVCGRLMCCLQYEHQTYKELIKGVPKTGGNIQTPDGPGRVLKNNILKQTIDVRLDDESILTYSMDELKEYLNPT